MKYFTCLLLIFCIFTISECKGINFPNPKHSYLSNLTITTQHHLTTTNLIVSSSDIDISLINIDTNCLGYKYCAFGFVNVKNPIAKRWLDCGFTVKKPTVNDIGRFKGEMMSESSHNYYIEVNSGYKSDYFSCYMRDENRNYIGVTMKLSMSTGAIVGIVIGIILFLLVCAGCAYGFHRYKYGNKTRHKNKNIPILDDSV